MNVEEAEKIGRMWFEEMWSKPDLHMAEDLIDPEYHPHWIQMERNGPDLVRFEIQSFRSIFSDIKFKVIELKGEKDKVWVWYKGQGTHDGNGWGFEPTHKKVEFEGAAILFFNSNGLVSDMWDSFCFYDILQDLGLVPPLGRLKDYLSDFKN